MVYIIHVHHQKIILYFKLLEMKLTICLNLGFSFPYLHSLRYLLAQYTEYLLKNILINFK